MNKIKIVAIALAAFVFCFAASCDNGTTGGSAGASSDEELFYGKWNSLDFRNTFDEYRDDGTWSHSYEGRIVYGGNWYLENYEGRSVLIRWEEGTPLIGNGYDYEFRNNGDELYTIWLGNVGGNISIPDVKNLGFRRID